MGVVWRARDQRLDRDVAIKQLLLPTGGNTRDASDAAARAMREGRIAARLQHQNAVGVYDVALEPVQDGGTEVPWLIMEYLPSRSLATVLREDGALPPREVARIGRQVASALAAAHAAGIVHRDVKPGNVLIGDGGIVKITDFGISRAAGDVTVTRTGILSGTPAYLAPEVARGETPGRGADLFSLGSTLYTAVEGEPPFGLDDNALAMLRAVADGRVQPWRRAGALGPVLDQLLHPDAAQRPDAATAASRLAAVEQAPDATLPYRPPDTVHLPAERPRVTEQRRAAAPPWTGGGASMAPAAAAPVAVTAPGQPVHRAPGRTIGVLAVIVLVIAAAIAVGTVVSRSGDRTVAATTTDATTTDAPPIPIPIAPPGPTAPTTTTTPPTTSESPPVADAATTEAAVREYYGLLPGDTDQAWTFLGAGVREQSGGRDNYERFWNDMDSIEVVGPVEVDQNSDGTASVLLNLTFTQSDGRVSNERYQLTTSTAGDGSVIIETSASIGGFNQGG